MHKLLKNRTDRTKRRVPQMGGSAKIFLLAIASFLLGAGVTGLLLHGGRTHAPTGVSKNPILLSESTRAVLGQIKSPVELRFYSLLDPATVPPPVQAFAKRVDEFVAEYERTANGKIQVTRYDSQSYTNANAAVRDGLKAFNADKGEACFLGIALVSKGNRESLPQLSPEWEPVLESDLTRAIVRLLESTRPPPPPPAVAQTESNALQEVKAIIPDISAVSLQDGTRLLRASALKDFQALAKEAEARINEAQQKLADALAGKSEAEQQAARKQLLQIKAEQTEKLKELAARSQAQVEAFERLKSNMQ